MTDEEMQTHLQESPWEQMQHEDQEDNIPIDLELKWEFERK